VSSLISSQSNYPLQTVIKGDSVVILTKKQANEINVIFESQNNLISKYKIEIAYKDSLLKEKIKIINNFNFNKEVTKRLDILESWMVDAAIKNTWIYYSWKDSLIYAVDLSQYYIRKDDNTGDIFFYRSSEPIDPEKNQEEPPAGWESDFIKPKRPIVKKVPIKM
jgi:hypothetical protein